MDASGMLRGDSQRKLIQSPSLQAACEAATGGEQQPRWQQQAATAAGSAGRVSMGGGGQGSAGTSFQGG